MTNVVLIKLLQVYLPALERLDEALEPMRRDEFINHLFMLETEISDFNTADPEELIKDERVQALLPLAAELFPELMASLPVATAEFMATLRKAHQDALNG